MRIPGMWRINHFYNDHLKSLGKWVDLRVITPQTKIKLIRKGFNIIGFAKGDFGLAEHLRLVAHAMKSKLIPFCVNNSDQSEFFSSSNNEVDEYITTDNLYDVNLFCFNAGHTISYLEQESNALGGHYNIGYGYWELSKYPSRWTAQNKYLDEIWAPSRFIKEVVEKTTNLPVYYMPIPVDFKNPVGYTRSYFNLPEDHFLYLFTFDMSSFVTRKNPEAVINAFTQAFPVEKKDKVNLIIKVNRVKTDPEHISKMEALLGQIKFDARIIIVDEILDRPSILGLISVCDAYVSLHRSEGFGLGMAEAMKMGKVVIATHYSGNKDFMNEENSCPVRYSMVQVNEEDFCYVEEGAEWAEPDIGHAVEYMKKVYDDPSFAQKIGQAARSYIQEYHSFKAIGENYQKRLSEIFSK